MIRAYLRTAFAILMLSVGCLSVAQADEIDPQRRAEIERIVHDYLMAHPEVIPEAMEVLRGRMTSALIADNAKALFQDPDTPVAGNPDGDVTIVEFFDYACGYCKMMLPRLRQALASDGNIRLVLKDFPILSEQSVSAAKAALAARLQGKYVPFHMALMGAHGRLSEQRIFEIAGDVGLDVALLKRDMDRPEIAQAINENRQLARTLGISGTPALVFANTLTSGAVSYEELMALVAKARNAN